MPAKFDARKAARDLQPEMIESLKAALKQPGTVAAVKAAELLTRIADVGHDDEGPKVYEVKLIDIERRDGKIVEAGPQDDEQEPESESAGEADAA